MDGTARRIEKAIERDVDRVDLWVDVVTGFSKPVPGYAGDLAELPRGDGKPLADDA